MIKSVYLFICLFLVCKPSLSETIKNIRVFHNDTVVVEKDRVLANDVIVDVYNMDVKDNATKKLNLLVKSRVGNKATAENASKLYRSAFSEVLNGPQWQSLYNDMEVGGLAIESAIRFRIEKIPAIVINDHAVIYGVTSLGEAIRIFNEKGTDR